MSCANDPLYVVDGVPLTVASSDVLTHIRPASILSIEVLESERATRYGPAGQNGVVLIQTRRGAQASERVSTAPFPNPALAGVAVTVPTAGLARGAYVVRVGEGPEETSQRLTVL